MPPRRAIRRAVRRPAKAAPKRIRLDNDERRAQLLALARKAFSDRSYDEVSIDDLAGEAKISKGLLYHYFPTKRDLYVAGLTEIAQELVDACTKPTPDLPPIESARAGLDAYLDHITRHGRAFVSLMRGGIGSDPEVAEVIESVRRRLYEDFLRDQAFSAMFVGNVRFETSVKGWIGFVESASIDWVDNPRLTQVELRELLIQVLAEIMRIAVSPA